MRSFLFCCVFMAAWSVSAQQLQFDAGFPGGAGASGTVFTMQALADDRVVLAGDFTNYNGQPNRSVVRIMPNGQKDTTFQTGTGADGRVNVLRLLPDGRVFLGGIFNNYNSFASKNIVRLLATGARDTSFNVGLGLNNEVLGMEADSSGAVFLSGFFSQYKGAAVTQPLKIHANGVRDTTFNLGGTGANGLIEVIRIQGDGKILIAGSITQYNGVPVGRGILRLLPNGQRDTTFNTGTGLGSGLIRAMELQPDGKIVVSGSFSSYNGTTVQRLIRLLANGQLDTTFLHNTPFNSTMVSLVVRRNGNIVGFGNYAQQTGQLPNVFAEFSPTGLRITQPGPCVQANSVPNASVELSDSSIVIGGGFTNGGGIPLARVARLVSITGTGAASQPNANAGQTMICPGTGVFLSLTGNLNAASQWVWYQGGCGLNAIGTGVSLAVSPFQTTTYYVRGEGSCLSNGPCDSITIYVDTLPPSPLVSSLPPLNINCGGMVPLPQAFDSCGGILTGVANVVLPITQPGSYTLVWTYTDNASNVTQQMQQLNVDTLDTRVIQQQRQLSCLNSTADLQWLRCDQQYAVQTGFTAPVFEPSVSGLYAVEVRQNGCVDTSECFAVIIGSVAELPQGWQLYPNPANRWLYAKVPLHSELRLYDLQGRQLTQWHTEAEEEPLALPVLPAGLYLITIQAEGLLYRHRLQIHQF